MTTRALRRAPALGAFLLLGAGLSACVLPPKDAVRQATIDPQALHLSGAEIAPAPDGWWKAFGDPQLDTLIDAAFTNNPGLAQALARIREAQAQVDTARAGLLPSVDSGANLTRMHAPQEFVVPPPLAGGELWSGLLGANLAWDIDFWGKQADAVRAARAATGTSEMEAVNTRLLLAGSIAQAYVDLYRNYEFADIADATEKQRAHILDITKRRVAAGLDTNVELRAAEGTLPQARIDRERAQNTIALSVHQLAALSGRGADAYAEIGRPQLKLDAALPLPGDLPINLLARRPDVVAARLRIQTADARRLAGKAAFYPSVNLMAFAGWASFGFSDLLRFSSRSYGAGGTITFPLFDAGKLRAQYRGAEATLDDAVDGYNQTVLGAVRQVADQLSDIQSLQQELVQQQQALTAAEEQYRLTEKRYRAGLTNYLSVLNADTQVLNARRGRIDIIASQVIARVTLLLALGGSFDPATLVNTAGAGTTTPPASPPSLALAAQATP